MFVYICIYYTHVIIITTNTYIYIYTYYVGGREAAVGPAPAARRPPGPHRSIVHYLLLAHVYMHIYIYIYTYIYIYIYVCMYVCMYVYIYIYIYIYDHSVSPRAGRRAGAVALGRVQRPEGPGIYHYSPTMQIMFFQYL